MRKTPSYLKGLAETRARLALVFASGFKGSAARLRSATGASVYFASHGTQDGADTARLVDWLWGGEPLPCWFWGDLDFSGMRILAALRKTFPGLEAWQPGYGPMLEALQQGGGHQPSSARKDGQAATTATGCQVCGLAAAPCDHADRLVC